MPTTMQQDIRPFLADEGGRYEIETPWVKAGWKYATDGRICVRIPNDDPDTVPDPHRPRPHAEEFFANFDRAGEPKPFPAHDGKTREESCWSYIHQCPGCGDFGCKSQRCVTYVRNTKDALAPADSSCPHCRGSKKVSVPLPQRISGRKIAGWYVVMIHALSSACYLADANLGHPLRFTADGGLQGVVASIIESAPSETA